MSGEALKISEDHVWVKTQNEEAQLGISDFAAEALGTIIYVELPEVGDQLTRGDNFAAVESGKASVELPAPISGKVLKVNEELEDTPDLINQDSLSKGWIALISLEDSSELNNLMTKADYDLYVAGSE